MLAAIPAFKPCSRSRAGRTTAPVVLQLLQRVARHPAVSIVDAPVPFQHDLKFFGGNRWKLKCVPALGRSQGRRSLIQRLHDHVPMPSASLWGFATVPACVWDDVSRPVSSCEDDQSGIWQQVLGSESRRPDCRVEPKRKGHRESRLIWGFGPKELESHSIRVEQLLYPPVFHEDHLGRTGLRCRQRGVNNLPSELQFDVARNVRRSRPYAAGASEHSEDRREDERCSHSARLSDRVSLHNTLPPYRRVAQAIPNSDATRKVPVQ